MLSISIMMRFAVNDETRNEAAMIKLNFSVT